MALGLALTLGAGACVDPRSIDGSGNHPREAELGAAETALGRSLAPDYADGVEALAGEERLSPREISNLVNAQPGSRPNRVRASDFTWQWGQFLDHDIDLTAEGHEGDEAPIEVPAGDPYFDPTFRGDQLIPLVRSLVVEGSGVPGRPREQRNDITTWIDASNVYGSDPARAEALRALDGSGRLKMRSGDLLPHNDGDWANAGGDDPDLYLAGDVRANEQVGLTAMHCLFAREHNRLADRIRLLAPELPGDEVYEAARAIVGAEMQVITYREFLPVILGPRALPPYRGYDPSVDASIANVFATAAFRFGHSMLNPFLLRLDDDMRPTAGGPLALRDAFFAPQLIEEHGIEPLLRGLAAQRAQAVDPYVIDDVRNFLFGPPGAGGLDLASLNIQRGREHGLPGYNAVREAYGLPAARSFSEVSSDPEIQSRLSAAYAHPDEIDVWVGGLSEDPLPRAMVGPLVHAVLRDQFTRLRDGDRYWYQNRLQGPARQWIERTRLSDVIRRNTTIGSEIPDNVFRVPRRRDR